MRYLDATGADRIVQRLLDDGYDVVAPVVRDGAVVLDHVEDLVGLPVGVRERQSPGTYRLEAGAAASRFGTAHGPDSAKRFLFPARELLATLRAGMEVEPDLEDEHPLALFGLRSCDLHAIEVQDRVFLERDPRYRRRRERALLIGIDCAEPASTCFCTSMGTGPRCTTGFDLALTELADGGFAVVTATERGRALAAALGTRAARDEEVAEVERIARDAAAAIERRVDAGGLPALLMRNLAHARWGEVAERCLACSNCSDVCPTCFCHDIVDGVSLTGDVATRTREWASCFSTDHSWLAGGGPVRDERSARYRQWLTHKFSTWVDQYGVSGCVGCGRCITWCPVGIDVTEELAAIEATDGAEEVTPVAG